MSWQKNQSFQCVAYSVQGHREANEDNYLLIQSDGTQGQAQYLQNQQPQSRPLPQWSPDTMRLAVADGMGGHMNGREASENLIQHLLKSPATKTVSQLAITVKTVHKALLESFTGMGKSRPGSTLIMADIDVTSGLSVIACVGDSRAYLLRAGRLHQVNHDQTYAEFAWRDGDVADETYFSQRQNPEHHLAQAVGFGSHGVVRGADGTRPYQYNPNVRLDFKDDGQTWQENWDKSRAQHRDIFLLQLLEDDVLLLASDGLWSTGFNRDWIPDMTQPLTDRAALEKLVQEALANGSQDNITVALCARKGATGGYSALDGKTAQVYQQSKSLLHRFKHRWLQPLVTMGQQVNSTTLKPSLLLAGLVFFWLAVMGRLFYLKNQSLGVPTQTPIATEDQQLFEKLKTSGLLETDAQKRLLLKAPDYGLARQANGTPLAEAESQLLRDSYNSIAGEVVRRQIDIWNQTREFTALRDSAEVKWQVLDNHGLKPASGDTVPEAFGFVHQKPLNASTSYGALRTEFNEWQVAQHSGSVTYQRTIPAGDNVRSQYIGQFQQCQLTVNGQAATDCKNFLRPLCKIGAGLSATSHCDFSTALAGEVFVSHLPATATVAITLAAVANPLDKVNGLAITYACKSTTCEVNPQNFTYQAEKTLQVAHTEAADSHFTIKTADGALLTNELGIVSATAEKLGLLGLIGTDKNDVGKLSYLMAKSHFADNASLQLTLDSTMQAIAQQVLSAGLKQLPNDGYAPVRRAALVVLDADNGDILASASFPQPPSGVDWTKKAWDKAVFSSRYALLDPFLNRAWQGGDANQAPGSTFKVVMALAAAERIQALKDDPAAQNLRDYVAGLSQSQFSLATGLKMTDYQLPVFSAEYLNKGATQTFINNFRANGGGYETMASFYNKPLTASSCHANVVSKNRLGVAEALRDSSNVWFAQLAKVMDGEAAQYHDLYNKSGELDLSVKRFLTRLGFAENVSLVAGTEALSEKQQAVWTKAALLKTPAKNKYNLPPLLSSKTDALMNLTQTAIGQSLYVTPLDMAQVATLAATGHWRKPALITQWRTDESQASYPIEFEGKTKDLIQAGLAAVVQVGTAEKAFAHHPDRCRVYGKTGTAQVGSHGNTLAPYNTAWFMGWRDPKPPAKNAAATAEKKLAFACMMTHTPKTETGGSLCAPVMANFFTALNGANRTAKTPPP